MNTTLYQNRPGETQNWTNLHLEPHDYWIYYVNIDLCHQYGISVSKSQTFLLSKHPQRRRARRHSCFCRLAKTAELARLLLSLFFEQQFNGGLLIWCSGTWYNEGSRNWQNLVTKMRFPYIEDLLFLKFYNYYGKENHFVIPRLCYIEVLLRSGSTVISSLFNF